MRTIVINNPGPQGSTGPQGVAGPSGSTQPFTDLGGDVFATTSSLQVSGSFLVSGSSTFTNIGPAIFSGSATITGATTMSSAVVSGDVTVLGTASINVLQINTTINSTGSNTLGDNVNDTQTLFGTVVIPTGSLTVSGIVSSGNSLNTNGGSTVQGELRSYQLSTVPIYLSLQTTSGKSGLFRSNTDYILYYDTSTGDTVLNSSFGGAALKFNLQNSEKMRILSNGNVGIGTTIPSASLHIKGSTSSSLSSSLLIQNSAGTTMLSVKDGGSDKVVTMASALVGIMDMAGNTIQVGSGNSIRFNAPLGFCFTSNYDSPNASAQVDIVSTTRGFLPPRTATTASITSPAQGLITYLTGSTNEGLYYYNSGSQVGWHKMLTNTGSQSITGSLTVTGGITMPNFSTITSQNNQINFETFRTIFYTSAGTVDTQYGFNFDDGGGSNTSTSGTTGRFQLSSRFAPTSGTAVYNTFLLNAIVNQTGGANGITRGLYINPTLTAAADFRAIEVTSGSVIFGPTGSGFYWDNINSRLGIGTATPANTLDIKGSGNTSGTTALSVQNSNGTIMFSVRNDRVIRLLSRTDFGNVQFYPINDGAYTVASNATQLRMETSFVSGTTTGDFGFSFGTFSAQDSSNANVKSVVHIGSFAPTSGTKTYTTTEIRGTINQTGGANGITRGLYVNPTLTSAADFRAIETTAGNILFQSSSTSLLFVSSSGNVGIGTSTPDSYYAKKLVISSTDESGVTIAGTSTSATNYLAFADGTSGNQAYRGYISYKHLSDQLAFGSGGTLRATIDSAGNLGVGTSTSTILARTHIQGSGTTSATTALRVENTNTSASLVVRDDNSVEMQGGLAVAGVTGSWIIEARGTSNSGGIRRVGNNVEFYGLNYIGGFVGGYGVLDIRGYSGGSTGDTTAAAATIANSFNYNASSVRTPVLQINPTINQTGTGAYTLLNFAPTINTTGSGISYYISSSNYAVTSLGTTISNILTLTPQSPLPSGVATGSFAVSSSVPPKPYFYDGTTWNALY